MRRLIGVGIRRVCLFDLSNVELLGSVVGGRGKRGAETPVATNVGVDAHPIQMNT
jgi:hypothetical protein